MNDQDYMRRAIELAKRGKGYVNPNPLVGAVIVKDGRIIAEGYHHNYGNLHAERDAFSRLKESAEGAEMYVTLEPCCHTGKQPPCTEAIIEHGIRRVVIGSRDPNPLVSGKGCRILREHGIEVVEDFLREECDAINPIFFHFITTGLPYVTVKYAMTLDGKIATSIGESKWITGEKAREHVHETRSGYASIMAGIGTVLADDPMLNVRLEGKESHQPLRVIPDSHLRIPMDSRIVQSAHAYRTLVVYAADNEETRAKAKLLEEAGVRTLYCPCADAEKVDLKKLAEVLGREKIDSMFVEGGGEIHESVFNAGIADHVMAYIAPKVFGGRDAKTPVEGKGVLYPDECTKLVYQKSELLGEDILLEYDVQQSENAEDKEV